MGEGDLGAGAGTKPEAPAKLPHRWKDCIKANANLWLPSVRINPAETPQREGVLEWDTVLVSLYDSAFSSAK